MTRQPRFAFLCGSLRAQSINKKLQQTLMELAQAKGAFTENVNIADYHLPLYHGDHPMPEGVHKLIGQLKSFDAVIIVTPEYNGGLPPVLKNAIDWTSLVEKGHITEPIYGLAACSPGSMGGIMCLRQLNYILMRLGACVVPKQVGIGNADSAFDTQGNLVSERYQKYAEKMLDQVFDRIVQKAHA